MLSEKIPYPAGETGALTQEEPVTAYPAHNNMLTYLAAEEDRAVGESGDQPRALSMAEPVPGGLSTLLHTESDPDEAARLRRLIAEKDRTGLQFALADAELRQRLAEAEEKNAKLLGELLAVQSAQASLPGAAPADTALSAAAVAADIARLKTDWRRAMQSLERENKENKGELVMVRGQLHQARRQLEQEHGTRQMEAAKNSASIASLETDLETARGAATDSNRSKSGRHGGLRLAAIMAAVVALTVAGWTIWTRVSPGAHAAVSASGITPTAAPAPPAAGIDHHGSDPAVTEVANQPSEVFSLPGVTMANNSAVKPDPITEPGFGGGMSRLSSALAAFPSHRPEDILREIHRKAAKLDPSLCAFEWNNGQPALLYGGSAKLSLAVTVERCAAAIEKYH